MRETDRVPGSTDNPDSPSHTARDHREKAADLRGTGQTRDSSYQSTDPRHHGTERAERKTIATKTCRYNNTFAVEKWG